MRKICIFESPTARDYPLINRLFILKLTIIGINIKKTAESLVCLKNLNKPKDLTIKPCFIGTGLKFLFKKINKSYIKFKPYL